MTVLLGALSALLYGVGDLIAGYGGREDQAARGHQLGYTEDGPTKIAFVATTVGAVLSGIYVAFVGDWPSGSDLWWTLGAAVVMSAARPLLYRGMTRGPIVVFAPVVSLAALIIPAVLGTLAGQSLVSLEVVGVLIALPAVVLVSSGKRLPTFGELRSSPAVGLGLLVGALIGVGGLCLSLVSEDAGASPAFLTTALGMLVIPAVGSYLGHSFVPNRNALRFGSIVGTTSVVAVILTVLMYQRGTAAVGSALIGMAPAVSIVLAWRFLHEKVWRIQLVGILLGLSSVALFALAL